MFGARVVVAGVYVNIHGAAIEGATFTALFARMANGVGVPPLNTYGTENSSDQSVS